MMRKLFLTGFVLLVDEARDQLRVVLCLLASLTSLMALLSVQPYRRADDARLAGALHLGMCVIYVSVLALKTCADSAAACEAYGMGGDAKGVFLFFFGFSLLLFGVLLVLTLLHLWCTGEPTKLVQARSLSAQALLAPQREHPAFRLPPFSRPLPASHTFRLGASLASRRRQSSRASSVGTHGCCCGGCAPTSTSTGRAYRCWAGWPSGGGVARLAARRRRL